MKQRLLVMNGQRILQEESGNGWANVKVEKAGDVRPGIYPLFVAKEADRSKETVGVILHADKRFVYQEDGRSIIAHEARSFDSVTPPQPGTMKAIKYVDDKAIAAPASQQQGRTVKR